MIKFPYYNHFAVKMILKNEVELDHIFAADISAKIIKSLGLKVVHETDCEFTLQGLTKVWVLSQSHMILHTWPENQAVHIDLMTCSGKITKDELKRVLDSVETKEVEIAELVY